MELEKIWHDLLSKCEKRYTLSEIEEIKKAYDFGVSHHKGKIRLDKTEYMTHPIGVSLILLDLNVDSVTIVSALIHETINHGGATKEEIESIFGEEVQNIVSIISKLNRLELQDNKEYTALNLRKVLVGMSEDIRVLFIKLADRLHNLRTGEVLEKEALKKKVDETMTVLIPIAHRLGMYKIKGEMEDWCLRYSKPQVYQDVVDELNRMKGQLHENLEEMEESISEMLMEQHIAFKIKSRVKSVYSIYNKLSNGKTWGKIYDILALRVIVDTIPECYLAIGLIHGKYRPIPGRFKDYIAMPKQNMYQSLHTGVFGRDGNRYEIQVRTKDMDEYAEKGFAAHFAYKEKHAAVKNIMEQKLEIFRNLIESSSSLSDIEFQNNFTSEFTETSVYVFTPKGDVLELPIGSTPLDFAYRIHTSVGDRTVGAIVNDTIVPLNYELKNNDIVSIKTSNNGTPNKEWLTFVKTAHAKNKIKAYFSKQEKDNYTEKGKNIVQSELCKRHMPFDTITKDENLNKILKELNLESLDDLYFSIGSLRYTVSYVLEAINDEKREIQDVLLEKMTKEKSKKKKENASSILVDEQDGIRVSLAKCCEPIFGDEIIGYITKGEGVIVHKKDCKNVSLKKERLINVKWQDNSSESYYTTINVICDKNKNYLLDIIAKTNGKNIFVESVKTKELKELTLYEFYLKTFSKNELEDFMSSLYNYSFVKTVERK